MKKYFLKGTKQEVHFGDHIDVLATSVTSNVCKENYITCIVTPKNVDDFFNLGYLDIETDEIPASALPIDTKRVKEVAENTHTSVAPKESKDMSWYIARAATRHGMNPKISFNILKKLWEIYPAAVFATLLKEVAIDMDEEYPKHINSCKEVYAIDMKSGHIVKIPKESITSYNNFAAFRTLQDALAAAIILRPLMVKMFPKLESVIPYGEQKN